MTLGEYLRAAASLRHEWGVNDCCTFPAGWIACQTGGNPMAAASYASEAEANAMVAGAGGMVALWSTWLAGHAERCPIEAGAIGVVSFPFGELGGIYSGERWVFLGERGIHALPVPDDRVLATWRARG